MKIKSNYKIVENWNYKTYKYKPFKIKIKKISIWPNHLRP